ncbi:hypothetical protein [Parapedobacter sp. 10938]|uniref:hypothetical protein n=1 Tax=Parapedobacter flavus TaxID=3110225 RepID=UPI002DB6B74F|nr:hypothetical protein [Parapedobacter sp. 10938]MEC3878621.1 hypothetical protein [Parapedobacter sp. 10938]
MKNVLTEEHALRELREIRRLLEEHFGRDKTQEMDLPDLVDITFALQQLGISRSTFYKHVRGKLLHAVLRVGNRDYFDRLNVINLHRWHVESKLPYRKLVPLGSGRQAPRAA